jgi:hypothetical protein
MVIEMREEIWQIYNDKTLPFLRNEFFKFLFSFNFFSLFIYYAFILLGPNFKIFPKTKIEIFFTIFLNGVQIIFIITEFLIADREQSARYLIDSIILLAYFKLYLIFCIFGAKKFDIFPYEFMRSATGTQYFVAFLVCKIILINYYGLYQSLLIKKNEYFENKNEEDKELKKNYLSLDDKNNNEMQVMEFDNNNPNDDKNNDNNNLKSNQEELKLSQMDKNNFKKENKNGTIKIYNDA